MRSFVVNRVECESKNSAHVVLVFDERVASPTITMFLIVIKTAHVFPFHQQKKVPRARRISEEFRPRRSGVKWKIVTENGEVYSLRSES